MQTQFKINGKKFNPFGKLITGIFLLSSFCFLNEVIGGHDGLTAIEKYLRE
jgi:hypothetical protein